METIIAAIIGAFAVVYAARMAYLQHKSAQMAIRKDMFEKRYEIVFVLIEFCNYVIYDFHSDKNQDDLEKLRKKLDIQWDKAFFLFGQASLDFIREFRSNVIELASLHRQLQSPSQQNNIELIEREAALISYFGKYISTQHELPKKFKELKIDDDPYDL